MTCFLYLRQTSTLQSLHILNTFKAEEPPKLSCLASYWPVSSSELILAWMCLASPRAQAIPEQSHRQSTGTVPISQEL